MKTRMWSAGGRPAASGFSLLEMLVVLLIVSLSAVAIAAALPRITAGPPLELAAARLADGFKQARMRAISRTRVVVVVIEPREHRFRVGNARPVAIPEAVQIQPGHATRIRFYPDGGADPAAFRLSAERRALRIAVSPLTGQVAMQ